MTDLETQVVKIQLGDSRQATSYVYTLAEKIDASESELYIICELPLFNPAASDECQRICEAIAASVRRSYRKNVTESTFEHALAIVNEELGKLVSLGKTHWLGKLNAVLAVKRGHILSVASAGKISALLYRDENFASVADSSPSPHPLKTFENFPIGKLRLDDLLILSTTQLLNHISVDRIKNILKHKDLPDAAQEMIGILQDNIGPEVACGTILALQVEPSATQDEEVDLQQFMSAPQVNSATQAQTWKDRAKTLAHTATKITKNVGDDLKTRIRQRPSLSSLFRRNQSTLGVVQNQFKRVTKQFEPQAIKTFSPQKKFFLISAGILLIAFLANIAIARYFTNNNDSPQTVAAIETLEKLANDANAAILYGDEPKATEIVSDLQNQLKNLTNIPEEQQEAVNKIRSQATELQNRIDKVSVVNPQNLGTLGNADHLITLPNYLAIETNRTVVSYNRQNGSIQDNSLRTSESIALSTPLRDNLAVVYTGKELFVWNTQNGVLLGAFSDQVPSKDNARGLKLYSVNSRVYMIDRSKNSVISFQTSDRAFSRPTTSINNVSELGNASDLAIDGNIYIAAGGTILKFNSGVRQEFTPAVTSFSEKTKLYTQTDFQNLYALDIGNRRIVILNKQGGLVKTLASDQFNDLKDFTVDEKNKTIHVLNNGSLLKIGF